MHAGWPVAVGNYLLHSTACRRQERLVIPDMPRSSGSLTRNRSPRRPIACRASPTHPNRRCLHHRSAGLRPAFRFLFVLSRRQLFPRGRYVVLRRWRFLQRSGMDSRHAPLPAVAHAAGNDETRGWSRRLSMPGFASGALRMTAIPKTVGVNNGGHRNRRERQLLSKPLAIGESVSEHSSFPM